jgi:hypothetical protein
MYIPATILKKGNFDKASRQRNKVKVFRDKVVDSGQSPLLYNIELGLQEMSAAVTGTANSSFKTGLSATSSDRGYVARDMLAESNIAYDNDTKGFSLLNSQSNVQGLHNKNIMDTKQFQETTNEYVTAENQFPEVNDPFYNLDENEMANETYSKEQDSQGILMQIPDLSMLASGLTVMNVSINFKGKTKYFMKNDKRGN